MTHTVKRGLGLFLLGIPLWGLAVLAATIWDPAAGGEQVAAALLLGTLGLFGAGSSLLGHGMIVWSLLRD